MSWQLYVGASILLYAINGLLHRTIMKEKQSDPYAQSLVFTVLVGIIALSISVIRGTLLPFPDTRLLPTFLLIGVVNAIALVSSFKGFQLISASENSILVASSRVWLVIGAVVFLGETLTVTKLFGALIIITGIIVAEWRKERFIINAGTMYVLLAAFLFAALEILSFSIIRTYDVMSYLVYACLFISAVLLIIRPKIIGKLRFYLKPRNGITIVVASLNDTFANAFGLLAYQVGRNALQIGPIMATQTIAIVILATIFLKERDHLLQKIIGSIAVVAGTILLL